MPGLAPGTTIYIQEPDPPRALGRVTERDGRGRDSNILITRIVFIVCVAYCHLACLPSLGLKIHVPPGKFVFFRSYLLPYDITASSERGFCIVSFMKQAVVDFYNQETGVM